MYKQDGVRIQVKGPKLEIFGFRFFTLIKPVWIDDLKHACAKKIVQFKFVSAVGYSAKKL
jgi:hypothetical protein